MCLFIHHNLQAKSQLMREEIIDWLPQVFADQDNSWVQVLLAVTDLYVISKMWLVSLSLRIQSFIIIL